MAISPNPNSRPNSYSRNSDANLHMRKSFSGNPFQRPYVQGTIPAEFSKRNSLRKEEKENDHSRKPLKPTIFNHYMLPTISASSKINPSPKKKILSDRNEPIKYSLSSPNKKTSRRSINMSNSTQYFDQKTEKIFDSEDSEIVKALKMKCPSCYYQNLHLNSPSFSESSDINIAISPNIAPLDADPYFPPYDPKNNFLSPRPQFRHYRPNPRLELYFQEEENSGKNNLEDMFLFESSDSEISEEFDPKNSRNESDSENSEKESEDEIVISKKSEEKRDVKIKSSFFTRAKIISLLLVLSIVGLSMSYTDSTIFDSPVFDKLRSSEIYEEGIFSEFARNLKVSFVYSTFNEVISNFSGDKLGPLQFHLTNKPDDPFIQMKIFPKIYKQNEDENGEFLPDQNIENSIEFENENSIDLEVAGFSPEDHIVSDSDIEASVIISSFENTFLLNISHLEIENLDALFSETESTTEVPTEIGTFQVDLEYNSEKLENGEIKGDDQVVSDIEIEHTKIELYSENNWDLIRKHEALAVSILALVLVASAFLIYLKNKKSDNCIFTVDIDRIPTKKMMESNPSPQNYSPELRGSEINSFGNSYSYSKGRIGGIKKEAQSQERKEKRALRRESLASSMGFSINDSPSYGSFTTFERIPSKYGYGDDEVVTPVRRSSRIKKI